MEGGHIDAVLPQRLGHGVHFLVDEHEVARDRRLAVGGRPTAATAAGGPPRGVPLADKAWRRALAIWIALPCPS